MATPVTAPTPALIALMTVISFLSGSLMFSLWLGQLSGKDIRKVGDGNPGMTNVLKAGGKKLGALAFILDALKGAIPVGIAKWVLGFDDWALVLVALAPIAGHAFSPFVGGHGGKAMAVTAGVWAGLTAWIMPVLGGLTLVIWFKVVRVSGWAVVFMFTGLLVYLIFIARDAVLTAILLGNFAIVAYKYRADLRLAPGLRDGVLALLTRLRARGPG